MAHFDVQAMRDTVAQYDRHFKEVPMDMTAQLPLMKTIVQYSDMEERCLMRIKAAESDIAEDRQLMKEAVERQAVALEALHQLTPTEKKKENNRESELELELQKNKVF